MPLTAIRLTFTATVLGALAACSSTPLNAPAPAAPAASQQPAPAASTASPPAASAARAIITELPAHRDPASAIARDRVVHFAYDSDAIDTAGRAVIERHARYLAANPALVIKVEGHADERGGLEYNLALGQRRAEAVRRALALLGVAAARVEATSWGEERPVDPGHDEAAWQSNRRGEIVYPQR